jgi:hypothetical protein
MSLPRNIINYSDIVPYIKSAIEESNIKIPLDNLNLGNIESASMDTVRIEEKMQEDITLNETVMVLLDEILKDSEEISTFLEGSSPEISNLLESIKQGVLDYLKSMSELKESTAAIVQQLAPLGSQRIKGFYEYFPPGRGDYSIVHTFDRDVYLTAITYSQIGWKFEDSYSLIVGDDNAVIRNSFTKEIVEKKSFIKKVKVDKGTPVKFVLHNNSGNSRQAWLDLEYLVI